jgi:16S rRNA processing protein RimM
MSGHAHDDVVLLGRIDGLFGIKGWVKVYSYTRSRDGILDYNPWRIKLRGAEWREFKVAEGRKQRAGVVVRLDGVEDRDAAAKFIGAEIAVQRRQLAKLKKGEYYWADLEGLKVVNLEGVEFGTVSHLLETGANDVVVVSGERERLIPYTSQAIREVDLDGGILRVDWDKDF